MVYYLIICRSLTYAQRTARALERAGIPCRLMRTPQSAAAGEGCSHCVRITQRWLSRALEQLKSEGLGARRVFLQTDDGQTREVEL